VRRAEFQANEQNMSQLDELLRSPVMRAAFEVIRAESVMLPDPVPGVDYQSQVAISGAYTAGAFFALEKLESLARPHAMTNVSSILNKQAQFDQAARERLRAHGIYSEAEIGSIVPEK
jgi:hypothetical protein